MTGAGIATSGPDIRVLDVRTGEIVTIADVAEAEPEQLAAVAVDIIDVAIASMKGARGIIEDELIRRLDRRKKWTVRFGDPADGVQWEIVAPSPKARSTTYDVVALREGLRALVDILVIDEDAAAAALCRTVTLVAEVGVHTDLDVLAAQLSRVDAIAGVPVRSVTVNTDESIKAAGVKALDSEDPDDQAAVVIRGARGFRSVGRRVPKIKAKRRGNS